MLGNYAFFVDVNSLSLRLSHHYASYILWLFIGKLFHPTWSGIIQNFATNILPFIYHLHKFESVHEYTRIAQRPGKMHLKVAQIYQIPLLKLGWNFWWGVEVLDVGWQYPWYFKIMNIIWGGIKILEVGRQIPQH